MKRGAWLILLVLLGGNFAYTQHYRVVFYDLEIKLLAEHQRLAGRTKLYFQLLHPVQEISLQLQSEMQVAKVLFQEKPLPHRRQNQHLQIQLPPQLRPGELYRLELVFSGAPRLADANGQRGFIWTQGDLQRPVIISGGTAWWPQALGTVSNADSMRLSVIFDKSVKVIAPGEILGTEDLPGEFRRWQYSLPYAVFPEDIQFFVGDVMRVALPYQHAQGTHELTYFAPLSQVKAARSRLEQAKQILQRLERAWGTYPFWQEGFTLVESNMTPMADGRSPDPEFIRYIASAWFGRSIRPATEADAWIPEAFVRYAEVLMQTDSRDPEAAQAYLNARRNDRAYRGAWLLHSLSNLAEFEEIWQEALQDFVRRFQGKTVSTRAFSHFFQEKLAYNPSACIEQYIEQSHLPVLETYLQLKGRKLTFYYRWQAEVPGFDLPIHGWIRGVPFRKAASPEWRSFSEKGLQAENVVFDQQKALFRIEEKFSL